MRLLNLEELTNYMYNKKLYNFNPNHYKPGIKAVLNRDIEYPRMPKVLFVGGSALEKPNRISLYEYEKAVLNATKLGKAISRFDDIVVLTGACPDNSLPTVVAHTIKHINPKIPIIGISPLSYEERDKENYRICNAVHDLIIYSDFPFVLRDGCNILLSDGIVVLRGASGTNNEIACAYEEGKVIGLYTSSGGVTDVQDKIIEAILAEKDTGFIEFKESNPEKLVDKVVGQMRVNYAIQQGLPVSVIDLYYHYSRDRADLDLLLNLRSINSENVKESFMVIKREELKPELKSLMQEQIESIYLFIVKRVKDDIKVQPRDDEIGEVLYVPSYKPKLKEEILNTTLQFGSLFGQKLYYYGSP